MVVNHLLTGVHIQVWPKQAHKNRNVQQQLRIQGVRKKHGFGIEPQPLLFNAAIFSERRFWEINNCEVPGGKQGTVFTISSHGHIWPNTMAFQIFLDKTPGFADVSVGHDIPPHITIDSPSFKAKLRHIECMCILYHIIIIYIYIYIYGCV